MSTNPIFGGIEAGGTKFICAIARGPDTILAETRFPTTTPSETLEKAVNFFRQYTRSTGTSLAAIGIAAFGPLDLHPSSPSFGSITQTPKTGWAYTPVLRMVQDELNVPVVIDTDVNGAALGEGTWGAARGIDNYVYITIGTGIGGGVVINGQPLHGMVHPEIGHILIPHDPEEDSFPGSCPFHGDCFEGLANGPAIEARWGQRGETLPPDHPAWTLEAKYITRALHTVVCTLSPERIILGGGVMEQTQLFPMIHRMLPSSLNEYVQSRQILSNIADYIVPPQLGGRAGVLGAIALAQRAITAQS